MNYQNRNYKLESLKLKDSKSSNKHNLKFLFTLFLKLKTKENH